MSESRKIVFQETAIVALGQLICIAAMCGIYWLLGFFSTRVLLGGAVGAVLAIANFFFMAVGTALAADKAEAEDVNGGKRVIQTSYFLRLALLAVVLFACAKSNLFDLLALVLPMIFVRPILSIAEFFRKSGDPKQ